MAITMYGIRNCDTIKKARARLEARGVAYQFHDYKTVGVERERLERWCRELGWESLLNRAGTTFRKLTEDQKQGLSEHAAILLMLAQPSIIKRPVLETGNALIVGFRPERYEEALKSVR
ncbi:MAG TPA: ArsC family reductase [Burkholderiales bacterium]|nr:ArsC family reductase [Burkholderiales bacterium]